MWANSSNKPFRIIRIYPEQITYEMWLLHLPQNTYDPRFTKQLSALAARFMEAGEFTEGVSKSELSEEQDLHETALNELEKYFNGIACAAKTGTKKNNNSTETKNKYDCNSFWT